MDKLNGVEESGGGGGVPGLAALTPPGSYTGLRCARVVAVQLRSSSQWCHRHLVKSDAHSALNSLLGFRLSLSIINIHPNHERKCVPK
jgi:hypothetical protein